MAGSDWSGAKQLKAQVNRDDQRIHYPFALLSQSVSRLCESTPLSRLFPSERFTAASSAAL
jgi:hypothetical protein